MLYMLNPETAEIGGECGEQHEQRVFRVPAHVEIVAAYEQPDIPHPLGNDEVYKHDYGQKYKKLRGIK